MNITLIGFLQFLAFGGGSVAVVSFLVERWNWFQTKYNSAQKQFLSFLGSAAIGVGAYLILTYATDAFMTIATPIFMIISSIFGVYYLGQLFHQQDKLDK